MRSLLTHPGTQYSHRLACQLNKREILYKFVTGFAYANDDLEMKLLPLTLKKKIANRILECGIPSDRIVRIMWPELKALWKLSRRKSNLEVMFERNESFQKRIPARLLRSSDAVIGFDTSSWLLARRTNEMGKAFVLDQSTNHPRNKVGTLKDIQTRFPDWQTEIQVKPAKMIDTEAVEHKLARRIVVASSFTRASLIENGVEAAKISVNPYGVAQAFFQPRPASAKARVRFLFMGVVNAAKGMPLILDAWKKNAMDRLADLTVVGPASDLARMKLEQVPGVTYLGKVPHAEIPSIVAMCDCLLFPSFFEGFGQVILEAMAAGLPVIASETTGGPDIIEHGRDGFIVPPGDEDALVKYMLAVARDPGMCRELGKLAVEKAKQFSWDSYGDRWKEIIKSSI